MGKTFACFLLIALLAGSCIKDKSDCPPVTNTAPSIEQHNLSDYITTNSISAVKHGAGFYYSIEELGYGEPPPICSDIEVTFYGFLPNGNQFEYGDKAVLNLSHLLPGWRIGLPLIKKGGRIRLYLPPSLAYSNMGKKDDASGIQLVPPNTIVVYDISLHNFY